MPVPPPMKPSHLLNRELSWLAFNDRVLGEARDTLVPLLERLKFLAILSANLDEFFMIRVAGLRRQVLAGDRTPSPDGRSPQRQREEISRAVHAMVEEASRIYRMEILPELTRHGIRIHDSTSLSEVQRAAAQGIFEREVYPVLTPLAVDPGHPFPHLFNKTLNLAVMLEREGGSEHFGIVQVPRSVDRLVRLPSESGGTEILLLGSLIRMNLPSLFPGLRVRSAHRFRVTRDADLTLEEELEEDPLLTTIERQLRQREWGIAVRLEVDAGMPAEVEAMVREALGVDALDVYRVDGPLQMSDLMGVTTLADHGHLHDPPFVPVVRPPLREGDDVFRAIREGDILLHHPYESFESVIRFVEQAAEDPAVVAIKQTLYRTSGHSPIADALARAAENGKQVAALVELRARFDEGSNILWARALERAGAHVVHGLVGLKTHCKIALVVRREEDGLRRYVHLSTGNYNASTARAYTDLGLLTCDADIAADVGELFNLLTGYAVPPRWRRIAVAPTGLKERVMALIAAERKESEAGRPAAILAKMNSLVDREVIRELYRASRAGVPVDLVVRGICCLRPGVPGLSENIRVRSVVDRFLEHERIFVFGTGDREQVWLSSADWMPRNFLRRIECMWPVREPALRRRLVDECLRASLQDNRKAWSLDGDGVYTRVIRMPTEPIRRSQMLLLASERKLAAERPPRRRPLFVPRRPAPSGGPEGAPRNGKSRDRGAADRPAAPPPSRRRKSTRGK